MSFNSTFEQKPTEESGVNVDISPIDGDKKAIPFAVETVSEPINEWKDGLDLPNLSVDANDKITDGIADVSYDSGDLDPGTTAPIRFAPTYYPKRFTQTSQNEVSRTPRQCGGEDVYIKNQKNTDLHANGIVLANNVKIFRKVIKHDGPVDVISPMAENGGIQCVIKKGEIGEIVGWDGMEGQWQFKYTLDLVSTGADEHANDGKNQIVDKVTE